MRCHDALPTLAERLGWGFFRRQGKQERRMFRQAEEAQHAEDMAARRKLLAEAVTAKIYSVNFHVTQKNSILSMD